MLLLLRCHNKFGVYTATTLYNGRLRPDFHPFTHLLNLFFDVRDALFAYISLKKWYPFNIPQKNKSLKWEVLSFSCDI